MTMASSTATITGFNVSVTTSDSGIFTSSVHSDLTSPFSSTIASNTTILNLSATPTQGVTEGIYESETDMNDTFWNDATSEMPHYEYTYTEFIYPSYSFEKPVYLYIWEILVILTFLVNIIVIIVLLQKKMRNPTNLILVAIALSDSMTGLVTLPSYLAVYTTVPPEYNDNYYENDTDDYNFTVMLPSTVITTAANTSFYDTPHEPIMQSGFFLSKSLCRFFMISKYFLSKSFHTVSIWMTLFLGFQRFVSVAFPFKAQMLFTKLNVVITCVVIAILAPLLHVYHLVDEKANQSNGMCQWDVETTHCGGGCGYLIVTFLLRHFLPCVMLVMFTVLFICQLTRSSTRLSRVDSNQGSSAFDNRTSENRRVSLIVTLIVVVFLIPEIPYGGFLLYALIAKQSDIDMDLETNRAVHVVYELSLVLSFHANFYIYAFFNRRFRNKLLRMFVRPVFRLLGIEIPEWGISKSSFQGSTSRRRTMPSDTATRVELKTFLKSSTSAERSTNVTEKSTFLNEASKAGLDK